MADLNRYQRLVERIFLSKYEAQAREIPFTRSDIESAATELGMELPKNIGDVLYSFRYRAALPESIRRTAPVGMGWIIRPGGRARYRFALVQSSEIIPNAMLAETKVPDSTPGVIAAYSFNDEQALLAKVRYNRLVDIFTGLTCYSLQNHLRTTVLGIGQVETDEIYIGLDKRGMHYVLPVQAKGGRDRLGVVQIEQDFALCETKFPSLICRPIAAQFMTDDLIALFEFERTDEGVKISAERHYRLVRPSELSPEDLENYRTRGL